MDFAKRFVVKPGTKVNLSERDADDAAGIADKNEARPALKRNVKRLGDLQYLLYAENKRALLIILQAMDAGGKDGTIRHVMGSLNPQGVEVTSFKAPAGEELAHDFLWRIHKAVPRKGRIGIFNRSHYEDVLIVRVRDLVPKEVWAARYQEINAFEEGLVAAGVHILKFYLHISKDEQLKRLKSRLKDPAKHWKVDPADFKERTHWDAYVEAYEDALSKCSTEAAPWYVIPSNQKWFRNLAVSAIMVDALQRLKMKFPEPAFDVSKIKVK